MSERQQSCGGPSCSEVGRCGGGFEVLPYFFTYFFKQANIGEVVDDSDARVSISVLFQSFVESVDALLELCMTAHSGLIHIVEGSRI